MPSGPTSPQPQPNTRRTGGGGDEVEFTATIKRSDRDPKFGFYSRPSKARKVA